LTTRADSTPDLVLQAICMICVRGMRVTVMFLCRMPSSLSCDRGLFGSGSGFELPIKFGSLCRCSFCAVSSSSVSLCRTSTSESSLVASSPIPFSNSLVSTLY
jgi:hypothetical protein